MRDRLRHSTFVALREDSERWLGKMVLQMNRKRQLLMQARNLLLLASERTWAQQLKSVEVGKYRQWAKWSDHVPLVVDVNLKTIPKRISPRPL
jgi:hypothetical protein